MSVRLCVCVCVDDNVIDFILPGDTRGLLWSGDEHNIEYSV